MVSAISDLVRSVEDPELPHVTIGDLGMVRSVEANGSTVVVTITPTYIGCPATEQIRVDIEAAVRAVGLEPHVEFVMSPPWTTDWITSDGHRKLKAAGIAPPGRATPDPTVALDLPVECPRCGSRRTRRNSDFGSTACKVLYNCQACSEPFEAFKAL
ncbi:phenylacetate-CoA oxygenase subunit PaaJ [Acidimicrobiaceae bacterium AH-315-P05]|nr:phenylacetate-CoA oxygenase subunit PaaJ [Acidimicrobiaceae bacterium AH-315-P05]